MRYKAKKIVALFLVCIIQTQGFEIRTDLIECCCHLLPPENKFGETANTTTALVAYSDFRQQKKTVTAGKKRMTMHSFCLTATVNPFFRRI